VAWAQGHVNNSLKKVLTDPIPRIASGQLASRDADSMGLDWMRYHFSYHQSKGNFITTS
jgi:hypothetical protein